VSCAMSGEGPELEAAASSFSTSIGKRKRSDEDEREEEEELEEVTAVLDLSVLEEIDVRKLPCVEVQRGKKDGMIGAKLGEFFIEGKEQETIGTIAVFEMNEKSRTCKFLCTSRKTVLLNKAITSKKMVFPAVAAAATGAEGASKK